MKNMRNKNEHKKFIFFNVIFIQKHIIQIIIQIINLKIISAGYKSRLKGYEETDSSS